LERLDALCVLADGRLASGSYDNTIRLWDLNAVVETTRLETDGPITCIAALPSGGLVAGDAIGRLHWLEVVELRSAAEGARCSSRGEVAAVLAARYGSPARVIRVTA
jgi:hypothetical protein